MIVHVLPLQENCTSCQHHVKKQLDKSHIWEDRPYAHRIAMRRGNSAEEGESNWAALVDIDRDGVSTAICPVGNRQRRNFWLGAAIYQIWWEVDLNTVFLWMHIVFGVASTD